MPIRSPAFLGCMGGGGCATTGVYSASGLYGCGQQAVGAACTALVTLGSSPASSAAVVLALAALTGQVALRAALRSEAHAPRY